PSRQRPLRREVREPPAEAQAPLARGVDRVPPPEGESVEGAAGDELTRASRSVAGAVPAVRPEPPRVIAGPEEGEGRPRDRARLDAPEGAPEDPLERLRLA